MDSDSDTLSAGDSDDGYMDGIRVQADGSDSDHEEEDDKASDTFDTNKSMNEIQDHKSAGHLTHLQKIKSQRKISSTPLHDYKNPSRILDPECVRGMVSVDKTKELSSSSSSDLKDNNTSQGSSGDAPGSRTHSTDSSVTDSPSVSPRRVKLEVFNEEEENDVFAGDEKDEAENNVNGSDNDRTEERGNITVQSRKISNGQKQRRNGATSNSYMNGVRPGNKFSSSSPVDLHMENAFGERVTTPEKEEAKKSLINITSRDNFSRMDSDPNCRSWTDSLERDQHQTNQEIIEELTAISDEESKTPDTDHVSNLQKTRRFGKEEMSGAQIVPSGLSKSKFLDSDSSSDQERDDDAFDHSTCMGEFNVIKLRPRTFTDTSTDDDEIRLNVRNRIKKMKKSGGESTA